MRLHGTTKKKKSGRQNHTTVLRGKPVRKMDSNWKSVKKRNHQFSRHTENPPWRKHTHTHTHTQTSAQRREPQSSELKPTYQFRGHVLLSCGNHGVIRNQLRAAVCSFTSRRAAALLFGGAFSACSASCKFVLSGLVVLPPSLTLSPSLPPSLPSLSFSFWLLIWWEINRDEVLSINRHTNRLSCLINNQF